MNSNNLLNYISNKIKNHSNINFVNINVSYKKLKKIN